MKTQTTTDTAILEMEPVQHATPALRASREVAVPADGPMSSAMAWIKAGGTMAELRDMLALQKEYEADEARKAFAADMAAFKLNPPTILKDKHVEFQTAKGITAYDHATIGEVCDKIITAAAKYGFTHRWVPSKAEGGQQVVTCVVSHRLGHFEETTLTGPKDESGGKNSIQATASTNTYLSRHSLLMAFGFATKDQPDDDGRGSESKDGAVRASLAALAEATTLEGVEQARKEAKAEFEKANDLPGWNLFKTAYAAKVKSLNGAQA